MALTPFPSSIGRGSNPQPSDCELSALPLDHSFCYCSAVDIDGTIGYFFLAKMSFAGVFLIVLKCIVKRVLKVTKKLYRK